MSKKSQQKQRQKRVQHKREKRNARPRPRQSVGGGGPELVSRDFLVACWDREPQPAPPELAQEVEKFDDWARSFLTPAAGALPSRFEIVYSLGNLHLPRIFNPEVMKGVVQWLGRHCHDASQLKRVQATLEDLDQREWPPHNPILGLLLLAWGEALPPELARWMPLWVDPFRDSPWPDFPEDVLVPLAERDGIPLPPEEDKEDEGVASPPPELVTFAEIYDLLMAIGAVYGWSAGPEDHYPRLAAQVLWAWAAEHEGTALGQRLQTRAPRVHPRLLLFRLASLVAESLPDLLEIYWGEFVGDPQSPDWVIHLAQKVHQAGKTRDAYDLLLALAERQPDLPDLHELLANQAEELGLEAPEVKGHLERGLAALEKQGEHVDPGLRQEYQGRVQQRLDRLTSV